MQADNPHPRARVNVVSNTPDSNDLAAQAEALRSELADAEDEIHALRRRLQESPGRVQALEERLLESKGQLAHATSQNEKLTFTLQQAKEQLASLREEVEKLTQPPAAYGTFLGVNEDGTVDVFSSGRKMRVTLHPDIDPGQIRKGNEVVLNESLNVVLVRDGELSGEVVTLKEQLEDKRRCVVFARADEERVAELSEEMLDVKLRSGDSLLMDMRTQLLIEKLPKLESENLVLEEVPDITYADVGGLDTQIEAITDAVELPYLHRELFAEYSLPAPKGILLYGPPGCGKTLIAKAVANSLAKKVAETTGNANVRSYFLNIKGPELLNKYVGETERQIRQVFQRAREKADEGMPVIVFFDEMESLFRTRGTGHQLRHGVDHRAAAAGRDRRRRIAARRHRDRGLEPRGSDRSRHPASRPPRCEDQDRAAQRGGRGPDLQPLPHRPSLPLDADEVGRLGGGDADKAVQAIIEKTVGEMYREDDENRFLEVTYQNGDKEILYYRDFASGAMIENIVRRAKKLAIKRVIAGDSGGIRTSDLLESIRQEYKENEDLPNTTNPDDWARISGKKGERIVYVRTLLTEDREVHGGRSIERVGTGQYL